MSSGSTSREREPARCRTLRSQARRLAQSWHWVTQQARNALWQLADEATEVRLVLHDRDRTFTRGFDTVSEAEGARVMLPPLMAPKPTPMPSAGRVALVESAWTGC